MTCEYFVFAGEQVALPKAERTGRTGGCDLREYGVEYWWKACKYHITRKERATMIQEAIKGRDGLLKERVALEKEFYEEQEKRGEDG